jgi:hypothetical protein
MGTLFVIGNSSKRKAKGMVGRFGEGLKLALVILLRLGCSVEVSTTVVTREVGDHKPQTQFRKARFYLDKRQCACYHWTYRTPIKRNVSLKKCGSDLHRYEVMIMYPTFGFTDVFGQYCRGLESGLCNFKDFLVPLPYFRHFTEMSSDGYILDDDKEKGKVYSAHFFIKKGEGFAIRK